MTKKCRHNLLCEEADNWWRCLDCDKFFSDENGKIEIIVDPIERAIKYNPMTLAWQGLGQYFPGLK